MAAARAHSSPVVRSVRYVAPWNANSSTHRDAADAACTG